MEVFADSLKAESVEDEQTGPVALNASSWDEVFDETYQLHYYIHKTTRECQWDMPSVSADHDRNSNIHVHEHSDSDQLEPIHHEAPGHSDIDHNAEEDSGIDGLQMSEEQLSKEKAYGVHGNNASVVVDDPVTSAQSKISYKNAWKEFFDKEGPSDDATDQAEAEYGAFAYSNNEYQETRVYEGYGDYEDYEYDEETGLQEEDEGAEGADSEHEQFAPYDEESAPPAVKNRSKDRPGGSTTQDYVHMARMYKLTRPYSDPNYYGLCLLCHTNFADMVYFPCEHRCVCSACIEKEHICSDSEYERTPDGYCNCSLCAGIIKLILPSEGGAEVEKYWQWVYEEPVQLPPRFMRDFRHSSAVIKAVHVRNGSSKNVDSFENASKSCSLS